MHTCGRNCSYGRPHGAGCGRRGDGMKRIEPHRVGHLSSFRSPCYRIFCASLLWQHDHLGISPNCNPTRIGHDSHASRSNHSNSSLVPQRIRSRARIAAARLRPSLTPTRRRVGPQSLPLEVVLHRRWRRLP